MRLFEFLVADDSPSAAAFGGHRRDNNTTVTTAAQTKRVDIGFPQGDPLRRYRACGYERGQVTQKDRPAPSELIP